MERKFAIGELAALAGVSRRCIHYYSQLKLVPPPLGGGRGHYYTEAHLDRLREIRSLQEAGLGLDEIGARLGAPSERQAGLTERGPVRAPPAAAVLWSRLAVLPGLEVHLQAGFTRASPGRLETFRQAVAALAIRHLGIDPNFPQGGPHRDDEGISPSPVSGPDPEAEV
ncbi:MAG: MerR family transcriptional regulator [Candidatus Riflebacteria bacterium]|nr:MerR family transcriptional regulator [Candidatus Riflebacteria bacterium]